MSTETISSDNRNRIVDRRSIEQGQARWGQTRWVVSRFDDGHRLLTCYAGGGITFDAHFNEQDWHEFRRLVSP